MTQRARLHPYRLSLRNPWGDAVSGPRERLGYLLQDGGSFGDAALLPGADATARRRLGADLEAALRRDKPPPKGPARHAWEQLQLVREASDAHHTFATTLGARIGRKPRKEVSVNATLPIDTTPRTLGTLALLKGAGYTTFKLKIGAGPEEVQRIHAARDAIGGRAGLRLDANGAWDAPTARTRLAALEPARPDLVEQPLPPGDPDALAKLARRSPIPVAPDEDAHDAASVERLLRLDAFRFIVLKPMMLGGPEAAARLLPSCEDNDARPIVTDVVESAVGRSAALAVASLCQDPTVAHGLASGLYLQRDLASTPLLPVDGVLRLPARSGLGFALNLEGSR